MTSSLLSFRFECSGNLQLNFDAVMDTPKVQTNGSAVDWYKKLKSGGKVSETKIKDEALLFFQVSPEERLKDKKVFKFRLENLLKIKKSTEEFLMQDVLKEKGGKGNHFEIPPADFLSDIDYAKKRRLAFLRNAREEMKSGSKYEKWCSSEFRLFDTPASKKFHQEKENVSCLVTGEESIKLVRERSSGDNIFDTERQVLSKNPDGTLKRSVIKETYARVTLVSLVS